MMNSAFVLDNDTILCRQTPEAWWPMQVELPAATVDGKEQSIATPYQVGRVELLASLAPSNWEAKPSSSSAFQEVPATSAITYDYAKNNGIAIPKGLENDSTLTSLPASSKSSASNHALLDNALSENNVDVAFISYRQLLTQLPAALASQLSQAMQLLRWQADTQFCSRCSAAVRAATSGERAMVCPVCRLRQYPRVQPCVITAITRPNPQTGEMQILLAHHHRYGRPATQLQYGLIAGFVEVGESLEHAVVREVGEEVGISLQDIRYVSSQPWPFPSNLMLGFRATYVSGEIILQEDELSHADFFDISNLPKIPFRGSIAYDLIAQIVHEQGVTL
ncbi:NAD(+) diphosphatase [uncultured Psychrobacter sp.]|uniref:NAD(+) diphosphatase n=1 Tax=uncultured Psychrobacter sp. TaxID=259303 RepID=UPI0034581053